MSILELVLGLALGQLDQDTGNRFTLDGLASQPGPDGGLEIRLRRFEATSLRMASGPFVLEVGRLALFQLAAQLRSDSGRPTLGGLEAANAEISGVKIQGPLVLGDAAAAAAPAGAWNLGALATMDGTIRAEIVDAHLLFDADVTVPIRQGQVDFNQATVEHVGPDSRMGVSRMGVYVDAANGRSYLYQFPSAPVAGVEYERRGALPGPWGSDRGRLHLQPFGEALLRQAGGTQLQGLTEQARLLFDRTALSGEVQLGDGKLAVAGVQADLAGRAEGRNLVRLHSEAVGRGLSVDLPSLSVRNASIQLGKARLACADITGALLLRVVAEGGPLRFVLELPKLAITGLRLQPGAH